MVARPVVRRRWVLVALLAPMGCYTLQPLGGGPPPVGTSVTLDVTDRGRVALGGSMGPEIAQIDGRLIGTDSGGYVVAVSSVRYLRGGSQPWRGEQVRIRTEDVGRAYERRFSRTRSLAIGAAIVGGVVAFLGGQALLGLGEGGDGDPPDDTVETRIGRRR
jgi:hypothetical protein